MNHSSEYWYIGSILAYSNTNAVHMYVCMYVCMYACMHACMYVCMLVMCDIDDMNIYRDISACDMI